MANKELYRDSTSTGLSQMDIQKIQATFAQFPTVEQAWLYGSRVKGSFRPYSDIDLSLTGNGLDKKTLHRIESALDDLLLPYFFDVNIFQKIDNEQLKVHIDNSGILLYDQRLPR
ncbi:MAG: nucleotidyltransferase domain-containing protein [Chitinophagaceae bacterium]